MSAEIVAVSNLQSDVAGAMIFWSLKGKIDLQDLVDQAVYEGLEERFHPSAPSLELSVSRAAESALNGRGGPGKKFMLRTVKRGTWDAVLETVVEEDGRKSLHYKPLVRVSVDRVDGVKSVDVMPRTAEDVELAQQIAELIPTFKGLMTATDVSAWLLRMLGEYVHAVSLRERGGFYFVPRDEVKSWKKVVRILSEVSDHKLFEIPALQSDDAVEAILMAFRKEVEEQMERLEEYLGGTVSTRGLNAWERDLGKLRLKTDQYAKLLGVALPDLSEKAVTLVGALNAARVQKGRRDDS